MDLLYIKHPLDECHANQLALLAAQGSQPERERLARQLRFGNATYCYYNFHEAEPTEADFLEWLDGLPAGAQAKMRALGFAEAQSSWPLRRYVLEKNDIGLSDYLRNTLSAADWQAYQQELPTALNPWLPAV